MKRLLMWGFVVAIWSAAVIFFQFNVVPAGLTEDEIEFARLAVSLTDKGYVPYSEYATGHATLYFYIILGFFKVFELSPFVLRLPSAIFGVAGAVMFYLVMHQAFQLLKSRKIVSTTVLSALLAILFTTTRWYFGFARFSFEATLVILLELISLWFILYGIRTISSHAKGVVEFLPIVMSGIFSGLAYNSYQPGRVFFLIPLLSLLIHKQTRKAAVIAAFLVTFGLFTLPLNAYFNQHQDVRITQQLYLQDKNLSSPEKVKFFVDNVVRNTHMFYYSGDASGLHNYPFKPALNPFMFGMFVIGLLFAAYNYTRPSHIIFFGWFAIAMGPTLFTYPHENPNMLRTVTAVPSVVYFIGVGIVGLIRNFEQYIDVQDFKKVAVVVAMLFVVASGIYDLRTYHVFQKQVFDKAFEIKDGFAGVYAFMVNRDIDIDQFTLPEGEEEVYERIKDIETLKQREELSE